MPRSDYKKALVTGGAGFIGSHIVERLIAEGMDVAVIDDLSVGRTENIPKGARFYRASILDASVVSQALDGVDVVFHNAARVSIRNSFDDAVRDAETNVLGTVSLLKECARAGIKKFIYASSMAVYGAAATLPVSENGSLSPASPYGTGKLAGESYLRQLAEHYGFEGVVLRYFNTYGPRQTFTPYVGVITIFITRILQGKPPVIYGQGSQVRDFIHAQDVAKANIHAMTKAAHGSVINVGTGKGTSVAEISGLLLKRLGSDLVPVFAPLPGGEPDDSVADVTELERVLGFVPDKRIVEMIDEVIEEKKREMASASGIELNAGSRSWRAS